jgi:hypothetical protein
MNGAALLATVLFLGGPGQGLTIDAGPICSCKIDQVGDTLIIYRKKVYRGEATERLPVVTIPSSERNWNRAVNLCMAYRRREKWALQNDPMKVKERKDAIHKQGIQRKT